MNADIQTNVNHSQKQRQEDQSDNWEQKYRKACEKLSNLEHEQKKIQIEIRNDLEFERKRANQFQEKFKNSIKYKNEQEELKKILNELSEKLKTKENQILQYIKTEQQKKRKITDLDNLNEQLTNKNEQIKSQLQQIKQGAISAILQKDSIISSLEEKLIQFENFDGNRLEMIIQELEEKYKQLEEKSENQRHQLEGIVESKEEQLHQVREKLQSQIEKYEQKIATLQQDIVSYEKHIQKVNEERNIQQNLEQKYYILEQKQRKTQKKLQQAELFSKNEKQGLLQSIQKLQSELSLRNEQVEQFKNLQNKVKQMQKQIKNKKKELEDGKTAIEKTKNDYLKKITQLEQQKKKIQDSLQLKSGQLERLKIDSQEAKAQIKNIQKKSQQQTPASDSSSLKNQLDAPPISKVNKKQSSEQSSAIIQKLKAQVKDLQQNVDELSARLQEQMKQVQVLRQRLVSTSGSAGRSDGQAKLLIQIQDLNSYIKKVEHNLMITKLKYAEDESHWSSRQSQLKKQIDKVDKKSKKEKAELLQRIDRMKKTNVKDKKTDYYQSSLK